MLFKEFHKTMNELQTAQTKFGNLCHFDILLNVYIQIITHPSKSFSKHKESLFLFHIHSPIFIFHKYLNPISFEIDICNKKT